MTHIGLLSDTHSYFDDRIAHHLRGCDEIWHAGDFGDARVVDELQALAPQFRGVYGNIDDTDVRRSQPLVQDFEVEGLRVVITISAATRGTTRRPPAPCSMPPALACS